MKRILSFNLSILIIVLLSLNIYGQQTLYMDAPQKTYRNGLQLFEQKAYGGAQRQFEQFLKEYDQSSSPLYENAVYYSTVCAVELQEKDAFARVKHFAETYPGSAWMPSINFELGRLSFDNKKYRETLKAFAKVSPGKLTPAQRAEFYYKKGFSQLKKNDTRGAEASFTKVINTKGTYSKPANYYYAHIQYQQGEFEKALSSFKKLANDRKYKKYVPNYMIHIYYELGDYQKVIDEGSFYLTKVDKKSKGEIARLIANAYFNLNDYEMAAEFFHEYENNTRHAISPEEQYRIGYVKFLSSKFKEAIPNFQGATASDTEMAQNAWYYLGFCYLNTSQEKFAQNAFLKAYKLDKDKTVSTDALFSYLKLTIDRGGDPHNKPVEIVEDFISKNPSSNRINEAYDLLAQLYLSSRNYRAALQSIEGTSNPAPKLQGVYQQLAYSQGVEYYNRGSNHDALNYFEKALQYTPDPMMKAQTIYWKADIMYRKKQYAASAQLYNQFIGMSVANQTGLYDAALYNLAYTAFNQRHYSTAVNYFSRFLNQRSDKANLNIDARLRLADSYYILKDYTKAIQQYDQVIQTGKLDVDYALYQKAFCYGAQSKFRDKIRTLQSLTNRFKKSPMYDDALYEIATTNLILNDQRNAIVYFDKLAKEKPNSSFAKKSLVKMGFVYYNNNQYDQAIRTLKKVVDKYPASIEAKEALNTLQNIYMDKGEVDSYFAYAKSLDFVQVSTSEEDSLTFTTAENFYIDKDYPSAIRYLEKYLEQFPNGGFVLNSYDYLTRCYEKQNDDDAALSYYRKILEFPQNPYTVNALLKVARDAYDDENYEEAMGHYQQLGELAENKGMQLEASDGVMRSAYLIGDYNRAKNAARQLLMTEKVSDNQIVYAHYILGKTAQASRKMNEAEREYQITSNLTSGELGAEATYERAHIKYLANKLDEAESIIYEIPDKYPDFDFWIAKGFILLADIYYARDNMFQAEQTLQSVIENYPKEDLKEVARGKLERLKPIEEITNPDANEDSEEE